MSHLLATFASGSPKVGLADSQQVTKTAELLCGGIGSIDPDEIHDAVAIVTDCMNTTQPQ